MSVLETFRFCRRVAAFGINTVLCWSLLELMTLVCFWQPRIKQINRWVPRWARINLWIFGVEVLKQGPYLDQQQVYPSQGENGNGRIFVANHRSGLDIPIMFTIAEAHCISRHDVAHWPLIGWGARRIGTLFVNRQSNRSGAGVLKEVDQALSKAEGVAMFPEGTVHVGDEVHNFRNGAFNAARRAEAEIVPVGMAYGSDEAYYTDAYFMTHIKRISVLDNLRVSVAVGHPLQRGESSSMEVRDKAREQVQELVNRARAALG